MTRGKSESTERIYKAAIKHYQEIGGVSFGEVQIDDLQECSGECPGGRQTKDNMRTVIGLMYKYALPRGVVTHKINLADYLYTTGEKERRRRQREAGTDRTYFVLFLNYF